MGEIGEERAEEMRDSHNGCEGKTRMKGVAGDGGWRRRVEEGGEGGCRTRANEDQEGGDRIGGGGGGRRRGWRRLEDTDE